MTIAEAAYLAALPKGPNNYHPYAPDHDAAVDRGATGFDRADAQGRRRDRPTEEATGGNGRAARPSSSGINTEVVRSRLLRRRGPARSTVRLYGEEAALSAAASRSARPWTPGLQDRSPTPRSARMD